MNAISVKNLSKKYEFYRKEAGLRGTLKALVYRKKSYADAVQDVSMDINEGEVIGFLGPNGAGKTTFLKMLSGILYPSSGSISVLGFDPQKRQKQFKKQFGIVMGQKDQLAKMLPPMDNFMLFREFYEIPDKEFRSTLDELISLLNIGHVLDIPVRKLSLGERMKCELTASLLHSPKVLFLDEPTIGLDVFAQKNIRDFIRKYNQKRKTTIILTSHYMEDIKELCERVVIINFGKIIYDGKLKNLITHYAKDKVIKVTTLEKISASRLEQFGTVEESSEIGASIRVPRERVKEIASKIISSDLPIDDILIDEMSATEIIRAIFEKKEVGIGDTNAA
ncbi:MAG: ATP-binding cassette domain-containing protein [Candidatus Paceibacterota bacterium]|jgi:ABC-2 type transport system ATP-binding protein